MLSAEGVLREMAAVAEWEERLGRQLRMKQQNTPPDYRAI